MDVQSKYKNLTERIFGVNQNNFDELAIDIFNFQYTNNVMYQSYCDALKTNPSLVQAINQIPFLPIQFFKSRSIKTSDFLPEITFESSGTTGTVTSKHEIKDLNIYEESFMKCFELFYGDVSNYCVIGLLPSYLERKNSSLVYMVNKLIKTCNHKNSGFYLNEFEALKKVLEENESQEIKTLLIGVSYALLDFSEQFAMKLKCTTIMETGGMKGRREELSREKLHEYLKTNLGVTEIHSEYGMTELLSQAYSKGKGIFSCPPWMKILLRAGDDPLEILEDFSKTTYQTGCVNIIDLANINSCCFIATEDAGKTYANGSFEITGRLEHSDIRGCGLMIL
jgi:hypothetical protein